MTLPDHELLPDIELLRHDLKIITGERNSGYDLFRQSGVFRRVFEVIVQRFGLGVEELSAVLRT